jgi:hypothetical protein
MDSAPGPRHEQGAGAASVSVVIPGALPWLLRPDRSRSG